MRADKGPRTVIANGKPASGKLSLALPKQVQDELPPDSPEAKSLEDRSDQDDDDVRLLHMRRVKGQGL